MIKSEDSVVVCVYGSLLRGLYNFPIMEPYILAEYGKGKISGSIIDLGAYPGLLLDEDGEVVVEWYSVTTEGLKRLDRLEGFPTFYARDEVSDLTNPMLRGWVYHLTGKPLFSKYPRVELGDWKTYFLAKTASQKTHAPKSAIC